MSDEYGQLEVLRDRIHADDATEDERAAFRAQSQRVADLRHAAKMIREAESKFAEMSLADLFSLGALAGIDIPATREELTAALRAFRETHLAPLGPQGEGDAAVDLSGATNGGQS